MPGHRPMGRPKKPPKKDTRKKSDRKSVRPPEQKYLEAEPEGLKSEKMRTVMQPKKSDIERFEELENLGPIFITKEQHVEKAVIGERLNQKRMQLEESAKTRKLTPAETTILDKVRELLGKK